jgi:hypothetical protein
MMENLKTIVIVMLCHLHIYGSMVSVLKQWLHETLLNSNDAFWCEWVKYSLRRKMFQTKFILPVRLYLKVRTKRLHDSLLRNSAILTWCSCTLTVYVWPAECKIIFSQQILVLFPNGQTYFKEFRRQS